MSGKSFYTISAGFLSGVFLASLITTSLYDIFFIIFLGITLYIFGLLEEKLREKIILMVMFLFAFSLGMLRFVISEQKETAFIPQSGKAFYEGIIVREPEVREKNVHITVSVSESNILLYAPLPAEFSYGDRIRFFGEMKKPESFETDTERIFDYKNFLAARGIAYTVVYPKIELIENGQGDPLKEKLFYIKNKFIDSINESINAPESGLLLGLLLGVKGALPENTQESFRKSGLSHIVVLSGFNLTIVAAFFMWLFSFLSRRMRLLFGIFAITLFTLMTGAEPTVIRASLMAVLVLVAHYLYRRYAVTRALIFVAVIMVFISPKILVFDVSFQLSFLATIGIIYATLSIEKLFSWLSNNFHIRDIVVATIATQILVTPFILYAMGQTSLVGLPANILVLPLVPFAMLFGFLAGFLNLFLPILAVPVSFIAYAILHLQLKLVAFFAELPFAAVTIPPFSPVLLLPIYGVITLSLVLLYRSDRKVFAN